jgi:uncharacterized protein HemX
MAELIVGVLGIILSLVAVVLALVGLGISVWQVRDAKRASRLQAEIGTLEAFLAMELAGKRRQEILRGLLNKIDERAERLGGTRLMTEIKELQQQNRRPGAEQ